MIKPKIVVTSPIGLSFEQKQRLKSLGDVQIYSEPAKTPEEWLERCKGADIICSGKFGLQEKIYELQNVFFSLPFVAVGWLDKEKINERNITVSYCPGCNRYAVSEWIIAMMLLLTRKFNTIINKEYLENKLGSPDYFGLKDMKVCILGKGNIGSRVFEVCQALGMNVDSYSRADDLLKKVKNADVVINTLSYNPSTEGLLNKKFFESLKKGSFFISVTSQKVYDTDEMLRSLSSGVLAGVADDCGSALPGDYDDKYYKSLIYNPNILATPHISYQSDVSFEMSNNMMIDNIETYIMGKPINLFN